MLSGTQTPIHSVPHQTDKENFNKYKCTTDPELTSLLYIHAANVSFSLTRWQHNTSLCERTSWPPSWNFDVKSKIWLRQSERIYFRNNPVRLHPDSVWNNGSLGFFEEVAPTSRDLRSSKIRFEFESAVPIRFESDGPPCLLIARRSQTNQTINGA